MSALSDTDVLDESALKEQLDAKDQLVRALTDRLEEAAEQLDRVQRTGGDKAARTTAGGGESSGSSQALLEKLSKTFDVWEDVQPREAFARIEERLDELRDMLEGATVAAPGQTAAAKRGDKLSGWEKMKAELMAQEEQQASPAAESRPDPPSVVVESPPQTPAPPTPSPAAVPQPPQRPLTEITLPEPVDFEAAVRGELEQAITVRDQYISELARRLRAAEARTYQPVDWAALNNVPADLQQTLQALESDLNDKLRIAEVDLSLERARLSRVETRIRGMQRDIERRLQQSAGTNPTPDTSEGKAKSKDAMGKSWFGSLGRS